MRVAHMKSPIKFGYCSMPRVRTFGHPAPGQIIAYISCAFIPLSRIIAPADLAARTKLSEGQKDAPVGYLTSSG